MRLIRSIVALAALTVALPMAAQERTAKPTTKEITLQLNDSLRIKPSPELQKALDELAAAVQALALKIATDPQLRLAAIQVASGMVATAQHVVTEQSVVLQEALKTASERIATAQTAEKTKKKP